MNSIYCKSHNVSISSSSGLEKNLIVKVEIENINRELYLKLTDEESFSFIFSLRINNDNFQELKNQQGLLVDFNAFGQKLVDLFDICKKEESSSSPKYILKLSGNSDLSNNNCLSSYSSIWLLNFIETNPFKHLTHLSLKFQFGDAEQFKNYLIDCLKKSRAENTRLTSNLDSTQSNLTRKLHETESALEKIKDQMQQMKTSLETQIEDLKVKLDQQKSKNNEKLNETESYYRNKSEQEKRDIEQHFQSKINKLESKEHELERTNRCLCDENSKIENDLRDLKMRYESLSESCQSYNQEINSLRLNNDQAQRTIHELECEAHKFNTRIAVLEQEVRDKDATVNRIQNQLTTEQESKTRYHDDYQKKVRQNEKYEKAVKNLNDEVSKGNEIIQKLQLDLKHAQSKIKVRTQITTEQEKVLNERDRELKQLNSQISQLEDQLNKKSNEMDKLSNQMELITKKLEEASHINKTNENVINWLNRQVTEYELLKQKFGLQSPQQSGPNINKANNVYYTGVSDALNKYRSPSVNANGDFIKSTTNSSPVDIMKESNRFPNKLTSDPLDHNTKISIPVKLNYLGNTIKNHQSQSKNQIRSDTNKDQNDISDDNNSHQQSLTSAYFPRPVIGPK